jgi:HEPN domain-containing protein
MKKNDIHSLIHAWFDKADKDLLETVCFHCQQSVEKFLKGYLIYLGIIFPKTHEIGELVTLCEQKDSDISEFKEEADRLTDYAVEIRYPDDYVPVKRTDAEEALVIAVKVKTYINSKVIHKT